MNKIIRAAAFITSLVIVAVAIVIGSISSLLVGLFAKNAFIRDYEDE